MPTLNKQILSLLPILLMMTSGYAHRPSQNVSYEIKIEKEGFRFSFSLPGRAPEVPAHASSGLSFGGSDAVSATVIENSSDSLIIYDVTNRFGGKARVKVLKQAGVATFKVKPESDKMTVISLRLGGMPLAHGLGDAAAYEEDVNIVKNRKRTYDMENTGGAKRWVSSFAIFPKNQVAGVFFDKGKKSVTLSEEEYAMTITKKGEATFHYLLGNPKVIYKNFKSLRYANGHKDVKPKFRLFEPGWESWDALGWNTNQVTVQEILTKFHENGYPIRWAVTGSGFWDKGGTTTSFGRWGEKFSDAGQLRSWMNTNDIKWMIGLRTNFIPEGGPYYPENKKRDRNLVVDSFYGNELSTEAANKGFLVTDINGGLFQITSGIFPIVRSHLLNGEAEGAAEWYQQQYSKWNVDGIKEDTMMELDSLTVFTIIQ